MAEWNCVYNMMARLFATSDWLRFHG